MKSATRTRVEMSYFSGKFYSNDRQCQRPDMHGVVALPAPHASRRGRAAGLEYDYSRGGGGDDEWDEMGAQQSERAPSLPPSLSCEYICMNPLLSSPLSQKWRKRERPNSRKDSGDFALSV